MTQYAHIPMLLHVHMYTFTLLIKAIFIIRWEGCDVWGGEKVVMCGEVGGCDVWGGGRL